VSFYGDEARCDGVDGDPGRGGFAGPGPGEADLRALGVGGAVTHVFLPGIPPSAIPPDESTPGTFIESSAGAGDTAAGSWPRGQAFRSNRATALLAGAIVTFTEPTQGIVDLGQMRPGPAQ